MEAFTGDGKERPPAYQPTRRVLSGTLMKATTVAPACTRKWKPKTIVRNAHVRSRCRRCTRKVV